MYWTRNSVRGGIGLSDALRLGKRALVHIMASTLVSHIFLHSLLDMPQKHAKVFVGGLGSLMVVYAWESELLSCAFYTLLLSISLGVQDTQQCLWGDWAL